MTDYGSDERQDSYYVEETDVYYRDSGYRDSGYRDNTILGTITRNPEGVLLMLAGAALLMRSGKRVSSSRAQSFYGSDESPYRQTQSEFERAAQMGEGMSRSARAAGEYVSDTAQTAGEYVSGATERVAGAARSTAETMAHYAGSARHRAAAAQSSVQESFNAMMREQPLAIAAIGLVAGAALAAVLPATEAEEQALGPAHDALAHAAYQAGENIRDAAGEAGETLRARASERGLDPEGLKDLATEVAGTFTSAVAGKEEHGASPSVVPENIEPTTGGNR